MIYPIQKFVTYERKTGRVICSGTTQHPEKMVTELLNVLVNSEGVPNQSYVEKDVVVSLTPAPSEFHEFNWVTKKWKLNEELAWTQVKRQRTLLLTKTDWVVTKAAEINHPIPDVWLVYRQALRDITLQSDPLNIVWPVEP